MTTINLSKLNAEQLAKLYVMLEEIGQKVESEEVYLAGVANCGEEDFEYELTKIGMKQAESWLKGS